MPKAAILLAILFVVSLAFFIIGSILRKKEKESYTYDDSLVTPGSALFAIGIAGIALTIGILWLVILASVKV